MGGDVTKIKKKVDSIIVKTIMSCQKNMLTSGLKPKNKSRHNKVSVIGTKMNLNSPEKFTSLHENPPSNQK